MNVKELQELLITSYKAKRPVLALGQPGVGKSASVYQAAATLSALYGETFSVIELRAATANPIDLAAIKYVVDGEVRDAEQAWLPTDERVEKKLCNSRGLVFVDEIADGTASTQSALQRLLLDRKLGSLTLAKDWHTVAASNRVADKAAAGRLSTALINRCITVDVKPDAKLFADWAMDFDLHPTVIAYTRWRGDTIWNFDPKSKNENPAFCSPRSMHILSDVLKVCPNPSLEVIAGCVGDAIGSEIYGFNQMMSELPDLDAIEAGRPSPVPQAVDVAIATIYALVGRFKKENAGNIIKYFEGFDGEYAIMGMTDLIRKQREVVTSCPAYAPWACKPEIQKLLLGSC